MRLLAVALVAGLLILLADHWQLARRSRARTGLPAGIAVVVAPACRLCDAVHAKLAALGVSYATVQADDERLGSLVVRAAPALLRIGVHGNVEAMRSGRAAIDRVHDVVGAGPPTGEGADQ